MCIQIITALLIMPTRNSPFCYVLFVCLSFACEGAHFSLFPSLCSRVFGKVNGGLIFTLMFLGCPAGANVITIIYQKVGESIFYIVAGVSVLNIVLIFLYDETPMIDDSLDKVG